MTDTGASTCGAYALAPACLCRDPPGFGYATVGYVTRMVGPFRRAVEEQMGVYDRAGSTVSLCWSSSNRRFSVLLG